MYFIDVVGMSLGDEDLPATFGGANGTILDVGYSFTVLAPDAYAEVRRFRHVLQLHRDAYA